MTPAQLRQQQDRASNRRREQSNAKRMAAVRYFADTDMSSAEIARAIGASAEAVAKWRREFSGGGR